MPCYRAYVIISKKYVLLSSQISLQSTYNKQMLSESQIEANVSPKSGYKLDENDW
jgi:hypothetical protein